MHFKLLETIDFKPLQKKSTSLYLKVKGELLIALKMAARKARALRCGRSYGNIEDCEPPGNSPETQ